MKIISQLAKKISVWISSSGSSSSVFQNMRTLMMGTAGAKVVSLFALPFITRLYTPEHFGVFALYSSLVGLLVPLATLKYEIAIPIPKRAVVAFNHLVLCFLILLLSTLLITGVLVLFSKPIFAIFDLQALDEHWWLVPVGLFGTGSYTILTLWGTRTKQFRAIARTTFSQSVFGAISKIGLAFLLAKPLGLLVGQVIQQSAGITNLLREFKADFRSNLTLLNLKVMKLTASYFITIPKLRLPSQLILLLSSSAPVFYSAYVFGSQTAGQIGLAISMIAVPMGLIGNSIGQAYFAEASSLGKRNPKTVRELTKSVTKQLLLISIMPALLLIFFGGEIFAVVFGEQWSSAGKFAGIFSPFLVFQFISSPIVNVLTVFNRQDMFLKINLVRLSLILFVFGFSYQLSLGAEKTFWIYSMVLTLHYLMTLKIIYKVIK